MSANINIIVLTLFTRVDIYILWHIFITLLKCNRKYDKITVHYSKICIFKETVLSIAVFQFKCLKYRGFVFHKYGIRSFSDYSVSDSTLIQKSRKINFDWSIGPNSNTYSKLNRGSFNFKSVQILIFTDEISRFYAFRLKLYTNNSYLDELIFTPKFYIHLSKRVAIETHFMVPILHAKVESYRAVRHGNVRFLT